LKPEPVTVTAVPFDPLLGEKPVTFGLTMKLVALVPVPAKLVTLIGPAVAAFGTIALTWVLEITVKVVDAPLKDTALVPLKLAPEMVTLFPATPLAGEKELTVGGKAEEVPMPVRLTNCALPSAPWLLSVMVNVPLLVPTVVGANDTLIMQSSPGASGPEHVLVSAKSPLVTRLVTERVPLPGLPKVTV